jgi:hypothetical protein
MTGGFLRDRANRALQQFAMRDCMSAAMIMTIVIAGNGRILQGP